MTDRIGQMDEGYFVSRLDILRWLNHTLQLGLTQIEQLGTGAVYCQLLDSLYPGRVPLGKVNWRARLEYEFLQNYKLLQAVLERLGIDKKMDINRLAKCKYQDNLEMIQWLKRYIELQGGPQEHYDPVARRGKAIVELPMKKTGKQNTAKRSMLQSYSSMNFKKSGFGGYSTTSGQSSARLSHSPESQLNLTLKTPIRGESRQNELAEYQRVQSHTERQPLRSVHWQDSNKLKEIRTILRAPREQQNQLKQIRRLLTSQDIVEEEEGDFF